MRPQNPPLPFDNLHPYPCPPNARLSPDRPEPEPSVVHLVSAEGDIFSVYRERVLTSETIRMMLAEFHAVIDGNMIYFPRISSHEVQQISVYIEERMNMEERMYMEEGINIRNMEGGINMEEELYMGTWIVPVFMIDADIALDLLLLRIAVFLNC